MTHGILVGIAQANLVQIETKLEEQAWQRQFSDLLQAVKSLDP